MMTRKRKNSSVLLIGRALALHPIPRAALLVVIIVATALALCGVPALASDAEVPHSETASAEAEVVRALLEQVVESYARAESYTIEFVQESYWALADTVTVSSARLVLVKPSSLSVSYDDGGRIVSDGESLRVYVPATGQFFVSRIGSAGVVLDPAAILESYEPDPRIPLVERSGEEGVVTIALRPDERFAEPARIDVNIDTTAWIVVGLTAYSTAGDRSSYVLKSTVFEAPVVADEFVLVRPEGAQLLTGSPYDIDQLR